MDGMKLLLIVCAAAYATAAGIPEKQNGGAEQFTEINMLHDKDNIVNDINKEKWLALLLSHEETNRGKRSVNEEDPFQAAAQLKAKRIEELKNVLFGREYYRRKRVNHGRRKREVREFHERQQPQEGNNPNDQRRNDENENSDKPQKKRGVKNYIHKVWSSVVDFITLWYRKIFRR